MDLNKKQAEQLFNYLKLTESLNMYNSNVTSKNYNQFIDYLMTECIHYTSLDSFLKKEGIVKDELKDIQLNINIV
jgi:hypothetical protein